jgi:ABC-type Fe3+-hydroxamate transport system substrate-binding protein
MHQEPRIVSLVPSLTELLCDLGLAPNLVGRTGFCIHPASLVKGIAKVGGTKSVNVKKIQQLKPSHLVVNIDENERPTVDALRPYVGEVVVTHPVFVKDNRTLIQQMGEVFNKQQHAQTLIAQFDQAAGELTSSAADWPIIKALYLIWKDPWMIATPNTFIGAMLGQAHINLWGPPATLDDEQKSVDARRYPAVTLESVAWDEVDCVLVSTEPYRFTRRDAQQITQHTGKPCYLIDGEMTSWFGTRVIAGMRYLKQFRQVMVPS